MADLSNTLAKDVMVSPVVCASPEEQLKDLETRFIEEQISGMPVVEEEALIGCDKEFDGACTEVVDGLSEAHGGCAHFLP